jgi:hypothetical protein
VNEIDALAKIRLGLTASLWTEEQADTLAQELYNAVAHELAEQVRAMKSQIVGYSEMTEAFDHVADEIDPEVET